MTDREDARSPRGTDALFADIFASVGRLVQGEVALARAEVEQSLRHGLRGAVFIVMALVLAIVALQMLAAAAAAGLTWAGLAPVWAQTAVGISLGLLALLCAVGAQRRFAVTAGAPRETMNSLRRSMQSVMGAVTGHVAK